MTNDDRVLYLIGGEPASPLDLGERVALAELRHLLADPATWAEPSRGLEDRIVDAISPVGPADDPGAGPAGAPPGGPTRSSNNSTAVNPSRRQRRRPAR